MTGRIQGTLSGRPVDILADGHKLVLVFSSLRSAWRARRHTLGLVSILRKLQKLDLEAHVQIETRLRFRAIPKSPLLIRMLVPKLANEW